MKQLFIGSSKKIIDGKKDKHKNKIREDELRQRYREYPESSVSDKKVGK